jgi:tyrosyl-tRNA synthetase
VRSADQQLPELTRGVVEVHQMAELRERLAEGRPLKIKAGFDPTRPDLHVGHTVLIQKMRQFQELGHEVIFLIGDFTAMIGDPTGQNEMRPRLSREQVVEAARTYEAQAFKILDRSRTVVRFNSEWLGPLALDQMIELAARRTVARTLERRDFRERLDADKDVYLHELLYPLLQGFDSVALESDIELGGTDQLFNLMVGRDLMRSYGKRPQIVMTTPLLEGIDAAVVDGRIVGKKMSKSAENTIGLTESPLEMFRKCMQIGDEVVWRYYELLSSKSSAEIAALRAGNDPLAAKAEFGRELVARFHGAPAADEAQQAFSRQYLGDGLPDEIPEVEVSTEGERLLLAKGLSVAQLVASTSEAKRLILQGGVEVDGQRVVDDKHLLDRGKRYLVRVGSKKRRFCYISPVPSKP